MSIAALLQAAEYIDRRDREAEHGYASLPVYLDSRSGARRPKTKKSQGSRTTHNELEKNRRAHLKSCLEKLKDMVPLNNENTRHTTLGLLMKAKRFIKTLEEKDKRSASHKEQLQREQRFLRRRLLQLRSTVPVTRALTETHLQVHNTRSESCSSLEGSSSGVSMAERSCSSFSENDEVDVIGYTSNQSDSESLVSSLHSFDSGVAIGEGRTRSPAHVFSSVHDAGLDAGLEMLEVTRGRARAGWDGPLAARGEAPRRGPRAPSGPPRRAHHAARPRRAARALRA